jgi:hypothetical protein
MKLEYMMYNLERKRNLVKEKKKIARWQKDLELF